MAVLNPSEIECLTAMVNCLIPEDELGASASQAGVVDFIQGQLQGSYGAGAKTLVQSAGGGREGLGEEHWPPAEIYRDGLRRLEELARRRFGAEFARIPPSSRVDLLGEIDATPTGSDPLKLFFELVLENTLEGFFSDPIHGGNRDAVSWKLIGFPGCGHDYRDFVGKNVPVAEQVPLRSIAMLRERG